MATACKLGEEITIGTTPVEYLITETNVTLTKPFQTLTVECAAANSGTIQFSVGETPPSANRAFAASAKVVVDGVQNGVYNLWAVGSGPGQKFTIF